MKRQIVLFKIGSSVDDWLALTYRVPASLLEAVDQVRSRSRLSSKKLV